ncbi:MAG: protein-tyrosine phosphatase family protein [Pseudomonadota bacterium]
MDKSSTPRREFVIATLELETGGRLGVCPLPGRYTPLQKDLATIMAWDPSAVLSMTERDEMEEFGSWGLGALLAERGVKWMHLPIRDYSGPSGKNAEDWQALSPQLHETLDAGGGVILHCRGGIGRSGMIALRLMVERDVDPDQALDRLRAARPGAVETDAQRLWAQKRG